MRLLWVWSVTRGAGPGWGGCDDPSGARVERGGSAQAGADDALTETRCGAGPPCADYPARGRGDERAGDRGQDGPVRRHGAFLAQTLQRARPARAGGGDALGASADLHRRGAQRGYRCGAVAARRVGLPFASWTLDRLVAYLGEKGIGMKRSRVSEVLQAEGLKWRQEETWFGARVDPEFERKRGRSSASTPPRPRAA